MTRTASAPSTVDPISTSVIQGGLQSIAVEMGYKLMRMSCSSIIRESEDFGAAPTDAQGRRIAESMQSTPLQSGPVAERIQHSLVEAEEVAEHDVPLAEEVEIIEEQTLGGWFYPRIWRPSEIWEGCIEVGIFVRNYR